MSTGKFRGGLAKLNYLFFTEDTDFDQALGNLLTALDTDIGWIREHTRLGELSRRWELSGKPEDQLLRGAELDAAECDMDIPAGMSKKSLQLMCVGVRVTSR
jgi:hypothetical protein